jgi:hypothetical protein
MATRYRSGLAESVVKLVKVGGTTTSMRGAQLKVCLPVTVGGGRTCMVAVFGTPQNCRAEGSPRRAPVEDLAT